MECIARRDFHSAVGQCVGGTKELHAIIAKTVPTPGRHSGHQGRPIGQIGQPFTDLVKAWQGGNMPQIEGVSAVSEQGR